MSMGLYVNHKVLRMKFSELHLAEKKTNSPITVQESIRSLARDTYMSSLG